MRLDTTNPITPRIKSLRDRILRAKPSICVERAKYYTESMKQTETEPMIIRQAKALAHVLENTPVKIFSGELVIGALVSEPPGAIVYPEGVGLRVVPELEEVRTREINPLDISDEEIEILKEEIDPYWTNRSLGAYTEQITPKKVTDLLYGAAYFILTEIAGIAHVSINYPHLLSLGFEKIKEMAEQKIQEYEELKSADPDATDKALFYRAAKIVAEAVILFAHRYAEKAMETAEEEEEPARKEELMKIAEICGRVPAKPPRNFHEALQFVWFTQVALHQENYEQAISMGRIDQYLYPYYKKDVEAGILDFEKAVELVECLWIKTNEVIPLFDAAVTLYFSGLPTNQAVTIGGFDEEGKDATNELTYVMLEAVRRVALRQPNFHIRLHKKSPRKLLEAIVEAITSGINNVAIFNDETIVEAWVRKKIPLREARNYSTIGCVEPGPFGTSFTSSDAALFNLAVCLELALKNGVSSVLGEKAGLETGDPLEFKGIDDVIEAFRKQVSHLVKHMIVGSNCSEIANQVIKPTPLLSLCVEGCFETGRDVTTGSAKYNFTGVQGVGLADVANSLAALDQLVFREKRIDMKGLLEALRRDFDGQEELRQLLINRVPKYGNDDDLVDKYAQSAARIYSEEVEKHRNVRNGWFIPGMYSMTTYIGFGFLTGALPSGRKLNDPLGNGISPYAGSDRKGLTAAMRSVTKIDHSLYPNGVAYTVSLSPALFSGKEGMEKLISLIEAYIKLGGMHIHFNVVDVNTLLDAQKNPEKYRDLLVRVAGYSAYFVDLTKDVQDEIIRRYSEES